MFYRRFISSLLVVSIAISIVPVFAENSYKTIGCNDVAEPTAEPLLSEELSGEFEQNINWDCNESILHSENKNIENRDYDSFEILPLQTEFDMCLDIESIVSSTSEIYASRENIIVDKIEDMPRNKQMLEDISTFSTSSSSGHSDDVYAFNIMNADQFNLKNNGLLSINSMNGNVSYSYELATLSGKNDLDLSLNI